MASAPQFDTAFAFAVFNELSDDKLDTLLITAGIVPCKDRGLKLQQALTVWFHGSIPSLTTFIELVNSPDSLIKSCDDHSVGTNSLCLECNK